MTGQLWTQFRECKVFSLRRPGVFLDIEGDTSWELQRFITHVEQEFCQAAVVLFLYERTSCDLTQHRDDRLRRLQENSFEPGNEGPPEEYVQRLPHLYARAFLDAVYRIFIFLRRIADVPQCSEGARRAIEKFTEHFAQVKDLRDSSAHVDERIQGLERGRQIHVRPVDKPPIVVGSARVFLSEVLGNNRLMSTAANGECVELEISRETMTSIRVHIQAVIDELPWTGDPVVRC